MFSLYTRKYEIANMKKPQKIQTDPVNVYHLKATTELLVGYNLTLSRKPR